MAKRSVSITTVTLTAFADTVNLTDATYPFLIQGGSGTQRIDILELYLGGQSTSSATAFILLSRDSTVAATNSYGTGQMDAAMDAATASLAAAPLSGNTNTTKPQRSSSLHLLSPSFNAFGGVVRWVAAPNEQPNIVGNTASLGEVSCSCFTGGAGIISAQCIYEPYVKRISLTSQDFERKTFRKNETDPNIEMWASSWF